MTKALFLTAVSALALTGCATAVERSTQTVYFQAVGATEVSCNVETGKLKYKVNPPQKAEITKSRLPLHITCFGAGNRQKEMLVESEVSGWTFGNVVTGVVPGGAWDAASGAMFKYPDIIIVDFTDTLAVGSNLPVYHAVDSLDPKFAASSVENLGPDTLKLPGDDAMALRHKMARLQRDREDAVVEEKSSRRDNIEGGWEGDKGGTALAPRASNDGSAYVPPRFEPPAVEAPAAQPPVTTAPAQGTPPGKAMPTPLFPSTTSF